jgi:hypothetical protein
LADVKERLMVVCHHSSVVAKIFDAKDETEKILWCIK